MCEEIFVGVGRVGCAGEAGTWLFAGAMTTRRCGIVEGKRAQEERVDNAEDGDIGADAEGENEDRDDGEARDCG